QRRHLRDLALGDLAEPLRQVEEVLDVRPVEVRDREQVLHVPPPGPLSGPLSDWVGSSTGPQRSMPSPSPGASTSVRRTRTSSLSFVGRFLPTKSARIGSSRCPRSTSTASW